MGTAIDALAVKLAVVVVPPYIRADGTKVGGYMYDRDSNSAASFWRERVARARAIASAAHEGQYDKTGSEPHIAHVERVAGRVADDPKATVAAYLHDTVEDTDVSLESIRKEFGTDIAQAVDAVTRRDDETYFQFIERTRGSGETARKVKIADLQDNYRRAESWPSLRQRFAKALELFGTEPEVDGSPPPAVLPKEEIALEIVSGLADGGSARIGSATITRMPDGFLIYSQRGGTRKVFTEHEAAAEVVRINTSWTGTTAPPKKPTTAIQRILAAVQGDPR